MTLFSYALITIISPLIASIINGFGCRVISKNFCHKVAILGVLIATACSYIVLYKVQLQGLSFNGELYTWLSIQGHNFNIGFLIDKLSAIMLVVVTTVSLLVHIYTIGYMYEESGYQRFFSYISLFTFMMLMLVLSNNFIQLFFGWEGVGLVSYLLIGFYFEKESAVFANLKAFLINRIGDCGFLLGIGLILAYVGSLNYNDLFDNLVNLQGIKIFGNYDLITVICLLLFIGAMGKSAQFPLHVWLPDSMEGPTPISALIHAATMVTAGIFMVARLSPLYNLSTTSLSFIMIIGSINCLFMGLLALIQNDIKRVIAYSTLSQLGYMVVALGCGAYSVAIFHLMTHAFFKGLLFLAAGSVIVAMHHVQDMRNMGGLKKYMPVTFITIVVGSLAISGIPPFAGFFSKDMILEAVSLSYERQIFGSAFAYFCTYTTVIVTALYSFRLLFLTFYGKERFLVDKEHSIHESPWVITLPLIILAIFSLFTGYVAIEGFVKNSYLKDAVFNMPWFQSEIVKVYTNPLVMIIMVFKAIPFYLAILGIVIAFMIYKKPIITDKFIKIIKPIYSIIDNKYYLDDFYIKFLTPTFKVIGNAFWKICDTLLIDGLIVNGTAIIVSWYSLLFRKIQNGFVNVYASFMIIGVIILLTFCTTLIIGM